MITRVKRLSAPVTEVTIISLVNDMILALNDFLPVYQFLQVIVLLG